MSTQAAASRNAYQKAAVLTATQEQLIVMLYDGAHRFLFQAAAAMRNGKAGLSSEKLHRAEAILNHLRASLDFERGGPLSERLDSIFAFCLVYLRDAWVKRDPEQIDKVDSLLSELRDAWAQVAKL